MLYIYIYIYIYTHTHIHTHIHMCTQICNVYACMKRNSVSHCYAQLFVTPWTVAYQAPPSKEFSREEYWSGLPFPSPGDLPDPGIESGFPALQVDSVLSEPPRNPCLHVCYWHICIIYTCTYRQTYIHIYMYVYMYISVKFWHLKEIKTKTKVKDWETLSP